MLYFFVIGVVEQMLCIFFLPVKADLSEIDAFADWCFLMFDVHIFLLIFLVNGVCFYAFYAKSQCESIGSVVFSCTAIEHLFLFSFPHFLFRLCGVGLNSDVDVAHLQVDIV